MEEKEEKETRRYLITQPDSASRINSVELVHWRTRPQCAHAMAILYITIYNDNEHNCKLLCGEILIFKE